MRGKQRHGQQPKRLRQADRKTAKGFMMTDGKQVVVEYRRGSNRTPELVDNNTQSERKLA